MDEFSNWMRTDYRARAESKKKAGQRGGLKPWEAKQFNLNIGDSAMFRVLTVANGVYGRDYHWPQGMGPKTCTANNPLFDGKCVYCHYDRAFKSEEKQKKVDAEARGQKYTPSSSRLHPKLVYCLDVVDFRHYHHIPGEGDAVDQVLCNVEGPDGDAERCEFCASGEDKVRERHFGGHRIWELKESQMPQLFDAHRRLQKVCVHQEENGNICGKEVLTAAVLCEGCEQDLMDPAQVKRLPQKELEKRLAEIVECGSCGHKALPVPVAACKSGNHEAVPGSIEYKALLVSCSGETKEFGREGRTYEEKVYTFDTNSEPFCNLEDTLAEYGVPEEKFAEITKPFDFRHEYRPEWIQLPNSDTEVAEYVSKVLDKQATSLNKQNPFEAAPAQSSFTQKIQQRRFTR